MIFGTYLSPQIELAESELMSAHSAPKLKDLPLRARGFSLFGARAGPKLQILDFMIHNQDFRARRARKKRKLKLIPALI